MKLRLLVLISLFSTLSYAQTFDWSSVSINGSFYVRQTVAGVQATCTNSSNTVDVLNGGGFAGSNGNIVASSGNVTSFSVAFSEPIDVQSIFAFDGNGQSNTWTFSPTGGANSNVVQNIAASIGSTVNVNWTNVTGFTITSSSGLARFALDDIVFTPIAAPCIVNIPDVNFKTYLVANTAINTNGDTEIQCGEATAFTGTINCSSLSISDLTGIEAFTALTILNCNVNSLTSLDVSQNTALIELSCYVNSLTSLDVSNNANLTYLNCYANYSITSLDVSNTSLTYLNCYANSITDLDLSTITSLIELNCNNNNINSLNVTSCTSLAILNCSNNSLSSLVTSTNTSLTNIGCNGNSITSLDVSNNTNLERFYCNDNSLTSLNLANGNNTNMVHPFINVSVNPSLTCITVDDVAFSTNNWTNIDPASSFSANCSLSVESFEIDRISIYPNPTSSVLHIKMKNNIKQATVYSVLGAKVLETTSKKINTSNLKNGLYLISIKDETGSIITKRFIKQ